MAAHAFQKFFTPRIHRRANLLHFSRMNGRRREIACPPAQDTEHGAGRRIFRGSIAILQAIGGLIKNVGDVRKTDGHIFLISLKVLKFVRSGRFAVNPIPRGRKRQLHWSYAPVFV